MTEQEVLDQLRGLIRWGYNQGEMARQAGVSVQYVNHVLNGRKKVGPKLLKLIGVERVQKVEIERTVVTKYVKEGVERALKEDE